MDFCQILYLISCVLLWICIGINIRQLQRSSKLSKDYTDAIMETYKARDSYLQLCKILESRQDYFHNLQEQEKKDEET